jgi:hypothetical protein
MQSLYRLILGLATLAAIVTVSLLMPLEGALVTVPSLLVVAREIDHAILGSNNNGGGSSSLPPAAIALLIGVLAAGTALTVVGCGSPQSPPADGEPSASDPGVMDTVVDFLDVQILGSEIEVNPNTQVVSVRIGVSIRGIPLVVAGRWNYQTRIVQVCIQCPLIPKGQICRTWNADESAGQPAAPPGTEI